jgi:hypothetical protein
MSRAPSKKAAWVKDLSFVFDECARVHELISNTPPGKFKELQRSEVGGDLATSSQGARIHTSCSSGVVRTIGMALG